MAAGTRLCASDALAEGAALGFAVGPENARRHVIVVRRGGNLRGYVNRCPHAGSRLDEFADGFFEITGTWLRCATHGALFRPTDGHCVAGPCAGRGLIALAVREAEGEIRLLD